MAIRMNDYADCSGEGLATNKDGKPKLCPRKTECWRYLLWVQRKPWPNLVNVVHADYASTWEECREWRG